MYVHADFINSKSVGQLNLSTICQPAVDEFFLPPPGQGWGLISLDWSNAKKYWLAPDRNQSTCEATNIHNAKIIKQTSPGTKIFLYHNLELALQWLETQRKYMYDPATSIYFLHYTDGKGNKNGTIYNEPIDEGDQYFWDFRVPEAAQAYIDSVLTIVDNPYVDGVFTDDLMGIPVEHDNAPANMNLSASEVAEIQFATQSVSQRLIDQVIKLGKYNWQAFSSVWGVGPAPSNTTCATFMRKYCSPDYQKLPMTMQMSAADQEQILSAFLITRPPYGWLGWGWESDQKNWLPIFNVQFGVPIGTCTEGPPQVFSRKWSEMTVTLDCNTWQASVALPEGNSTLSFRSLIDNAHK